MVYANGTTCVPNLANKRILVNYTIGPNTDIRVWNGPSTEIIPLHFSFYLYSVRISQASKSLEGAFHMNNT